MHGMGSESIDPRWPKLLSLAVHEFRTPITVVAGYIRMLLKERAGALTDQQRKLLEEAEKSCGRLSALVSEMSDLSALEAGTATLNRARLDVAELLGEVVAGLPPLPDRDIAVELDGMTSPAPVMGDATRLRSALTSLLLALRREVVTSDRLLVRVCGGDGTRECAIAIADANEIDTVGSAGRESLQRFDEWRGGSGLSLAIARRIIAQHGGSLHGAPGELKTAAVIFLPRA